MLIAKEKRLVIPRYEYIRNSDDIGRRSGIDESYFKKCKLIFHDRLILEHSERLFGAYMHYEAIQAMVVAKAITLSKQQDAAQNRKEIEAINSLQKRLETFQANFIILFFADAFASLGDLSNGQIEQPEESSDEMPFGKLIELMYEGEVSISLSETLSFQRYFRQRIKTADDIETLSRRTSDEWFSLCDVLDGYNNVRYTQIDDVLFALNERFKDFVDALRFEGKKRCLLFGKQGKTIYFTISGIHDSAEKKIPGYKKAQQEIRSAVKAVLSNLSMSENQRLVYVKAEPGIRFYGDEAIVNGAYIKLEELESLESLPNDAERKFSCCERKLSAYLRNGKRARKLSDLDFLLCRYDPCLKCYVEVKDLANFYVYGNGACKHLLLPSFETNEICDEAVEFMKRRRSGYSLDAGKEYIRWKKCI